MNIVSPGKFTVQVEEEQRNAFARLMNFTFSSNLPPNRCMRFKAPAGTGKTHTVRELIHIIRALKITIPPAVVAFTGKAASQLSTEGIAAETIHSLLYKPEVDEFGDLIRWTRNSVDEIRAAHSMILVDEASMIPPSILKDLLAIKLPLILIGDSSQLDAVEPDLDEPFNVMDGENDDYLFVTHPDCVLHKNRRTNPEQIGITKLMLHFRESANIPRMVGKGMKQVQKALALTPQFHKDNKFDLVICGTNKTRKLLNSLIRTARGHRNKRASVGESLINLQNDVIGFEKIYNGDIFTVANIVEEYSDSAKYTLIRDRDKNEFIIRILDDTLHTEQVPRTNTKDNKPKKFTFGYAVSVHKAQGSSIDNVLFIDENVSFFTDQRKFRYTGVSRAAKNLTFAI
jgi:exodeoxyribonuclease-5